MSILMRYIYPDYAMVSIEEITQLTDMFTIANKLKNTDNNVSVEETADKYLSLYNAEYGTAYVSVEGFFDDLAKKFERFKDKVGDFLGRGLEAMLYRSVGTAERLTNRFSKYDDEKIKRFDEEAKNLEHEYAGDAKAYSPSQVWDNIMKHMSDVEKLVKQSTTAFSKISSGINNESALDDIFKGYDKVVFKMCGFTSNIEANAVDHNFNPPVSKQSNKLKFKDIKQFAENFDSDLKRVDPHVVKAYESYFATCQDLENLAEEAGNNAFNHEVARRAFICYTYPYLFMTFVRLYFDYVLWVGSECHSLID